MSRKSIFLVGVPPAVIIFDRLSKWYISSTFDLHESREIIPNFFHITYILNKGAAFGLLSTSNSPLVRPFFLVITVLATGLLLWVYTKAASDNSLHLLGITLLLGGAVGNFTDRCIQGRVVDFLDFHWYAYHWPAFNIADSAITVGVFLLLTDTFLSSRGRDPIKPGKRIEP